MTVQKQVILVLTRHAKVAEKLWIKNLWERVKEYCEKCSKCSMTKVPSKTTYSEPGIMPIPKNPMDCLQIDIQGPYIRSTKGNKNIIVITDHFTRLFSKAVKQATTKDIIRFVQKVIEENGLPLIIQSDQGTPFMSRKFQEFLRSYKIQHKISTPYHPKTTQGLVERANQTLNYRLRLLTPRNNLRT